MSGLSLFLKENQKVKENIKIPATKSLLDNEGNPLLWEIRALSTKEETAIRSDCTYEVQVTGKPNVFREKVDAHKLMDRICTASIIYPDLHNAQLQDSYGVMTPEDLLKEMICDPGEYLEFQQKIQEYAGYSSINDKVEEAKN